MGSTKLKLPAFVLSALTYLSEKDKRAFQKKFEQQRDDEQQLVHTQKELIVGVFGAMMGFTPEYEPKIGRKTPDWRFLDRDANPCFFADVLSFHINESIARDMEKELRGHNGWCGDLPGSEIRLRSKLEEKAGKYKELSDEADLPFVVFVYATFDSFLEPMEIDFCLQKSDYALCKAYPELSCVFHFSDGVRDGMSLGYRFRESVNPYALRPLSLAGESVPLPIPSANKN